MLLAQTGTGTQEALWFWIALLIAAGGTGGSLWLSLGKKLKACPLCFYQRSFVIAPLGVLLLGALSGTGQWDLFALLALPAATPGLAIAVFHVYLELSGKLECPPGALNLGSVPKQSCLMFVLLTAALVLQALGAEVSGVLGAGGLIAIAVLFGVLLAAGSVAATPGPPPPPKEPYPGPPETCRPPYRGSEVASG